MGRLIMVLFGIILIVMYGVLLQMHLSSTTDKLKWVCDKNVRLYPIAFGICFVVYGIFAWQDTVTDVERWCMAITTAINCCILNYDKVEKFITNLISKKVESEMNVILIVKCIQTFGICILSSPISIVLS